MRRSLFSLAMLALLPLAGHAQQASWTAEQEAIYRQFLEAFDSGADCARLFQLRNSFRVPFHETPQELEANEKLRSVSCSGPNAERKKPTQNDASFTVKEYRIYRAVIDAPMSISESEARAKAAKRFDVSSAEVKKVVDTVQQILFRNGWISTADNEIRHASDWAGENE